MADPPCFSTNYSVLKSRYLIERQNRFFDKVVFLTLFYDFCFSEFGKLENERIGSCTTASQVLFLH